ncbi:uncharacterized protein LOC128883276 isoform X2 [Hylaeus volcanicus]|uniref:uncharacterized protein LOC128883276 isoform X2 n=1 Tax=Hylaeus volcanicus TaxID=313075 RepID=UPI0023B86ECC|nr:uncharacterized protein LOC128883276 isoform X2 [Hylaeus volcanicus]
MTQRTQVVWSQEKIHSFIQCILNLLNLNVRKDLEKQLRVVYKSEITTHQCPNSHKEAFPLIVQHGFSYISYRFKKKQDDILGEILDSVMHPSGLRDILSNISEKAAVVTTNVISKAKKENVYFDEATIQTLRKKVLKESSIRCIMERVHVCCFKSHASDSKERAFLASPGDCRLQSFNILKNATIYHFMNDGFAVQKNFLGENIRKAVLSEIELIEFDGQLQELKTLCQTSPRARMDRVCWLQKSQIDPERHKGLHLLTEKLSVFPYEMNRKVPGSMCQQATMYQIAVFPGKGAELKKHLDGGFCEKTDIGRKVTVLYFPNETQSSKEKKLTLSLYSPDPSKGSLTSTPDTPLSSDSQFEKNLKCTTFQPKSDSLLILKSRTVAYKIHPTVVKIFIITMWITGPVSFNYNF